MAAFNGKTVLVVDDEPAVSQLLNVLLTSQGYATKIAATGRQALDSVFGNIDLILLDMVLPDIEGIKVCQQLKSNSQSKNIPIIAISGKQNKTDRIESLYTGAEDYLTKPFEPDELLARMDVILRNHHVKTNEESLRL